MTQKVGHSAFIAIHSTILLKCVKGVISESGLCLVNCVILFQTLMIWIIMQKSVWLMKNHDASGVTLIEWIYHHQLPPFTNLNVNSFGKFAQPVISIMKAGYSDSYWEIGQTGI